MDKYRKALLNLVYVLEKLLFNTCILVYQYFALDVIL